MQRKMNKKGFTIVELVIVIVVIAILAAVLIPTFVSLTKKANESKDIQLVRNLNTALAADNEKHATMHSALEAAADFGYDVDKINASATDNQILWDSVNDVFVYLKDGNIEYIPETTIQNESVADYQYWMISNEMPSEQKYSVYAGNDFTATTIENLTVGFDAGNATGITSITYVGANSVVIRTNSDSTNLTVDNASAEVYHYGVSGEVEILSAANDSYHLFGKAKSIVATNGRVVVENGAVVNLVYVTSNDAIVDVVAGADVATVGKAAGVNAQISGATAVECDKDSAVSGATLFAGGFGTAEHPYLIESAQQLQNVSEKYDSYKYYKVKDGVERIDCTGWSKNVNLNGSFDGNGVELVNLTAALFNTVGYQNTVQEIKIANFTANMNATTALVHNLFNGGTTTFENIQMHGYIEAKYNIGSFYRYGTANYSTTGCDYTVNFVNCQSDVAIVETSGNVPGGLFGHAYCGENNTATINIDDKTVYTGTLYGTAAKGNTYGAILPAGSVINVNGTSVENTQYGNYKKLSIVPATKAEDGSYVVEKQSSTTSMSVSVNAQISAYDESGNKIANSAGITFVVDTIVLTELADSTKVLDAFESVELITGADEYKYEISDGVLKIYAKKSASYTYDGNITLQVVQYEANGTVASVGSVSIGTIEK